MNSYWLIGGATALVVLLVASVTVAVTRRPEPLPPGTPERSVQAFLIALQNEEFSNAHSLLTDELKTSCTTEELASGPMYHTDDLKNSRVTLEKTIPLDGSAVVTTRITRTLGVSLFGLSESSYTQTFNLKQVNGVWLLSEYTWPDYACQRVGGSPRVTQVEMLNHGAGPPGSPKKVLQQFLMAVSDSENDMTPNFLSYHLKSRSSLDQWRTAPLLHTTDRVTLGGQTRPDDTIALIPLVSRIHEADRLTLSTLSRIP